MQHCFPGAGGDDQAGLAQRPGVARHGRGTDSQLGRQFGGGALAAGETEHGGAGVAEQFADWVGGGFVDLRERGYRRVEDYRRPVGMCADHGAAGPQHRGQQREASAAGEDLKLCGRSDLQHRPAPADVSCRVGLKLD